MAADLEVGRGRGKRGMWRGEREIGSRRELKVREGGGEEEWVGSAGVRKGERNRRGRKG